MAQIMLNIEEPDAGYKGPLLLTSGHRPFFLLAALWAVVGLGLWVAAWYGYLPLGPVWHGHEMLFGFAIAAISGFLCAAVPKWTNQPPIQGGRLALLIVLWLAGRAGMAVGGVAALADLLFLPALAFMVGGQIFAARNKRNYQVPALLMAIWALNAAYHFYDPSLALRVAVFLVTAMIALIGGRIVPAFTQNALRMHTGDKSITCSTPPVIDRLAVPSLVVTAAVELAWPGSLAAGVLALATAAIHFARMAGWQIHRTFAIPLVWILHAGYVWLPLGYLLMGLSHVWGVVDPGRALHALTAGAIGVMILAVGSRAALGHSGRPLVATPATVVAYVLVIAAAVLRVFAPLEWHAAMAVAGVLWTAGFAVFSVAYWPVLARPRIDGLPG